MKIPKLFKKAAAFVMAAVTALSIMPATAFAAGDIGTIFFSHTYDSNGNAMRYNSSANIGGYTAGGTDKNGEIVIEGLRIGDYTVSEVSDKASAGYILPADKQATVKVDATAIVQMHNEFRDTPKTGDDFNLGLWVSLAALSVVGAGVLGFVGYKNRKKKKED